MLDFMNSPPFFQNVTIDMPVDEEGALETIEQLRDRYDTLLLVCFEQWQMFPLTSFIVQTFTWILANILIIFAINFAKENWL